MRDQNISEQSEQSGHSQTSETNQARKARMEKNRAIRKEKLTYQRSNEIISEKAILTKEEKMKIQKVKNREAAQRSRDQKKIYIQTLQAQIQTLKKQLSEPKYCYKCQCMINNNHGIIEVGDENFMDHENHLADQSPFMRIQNQQQISPLKFLLFISLIFICAFAPTNEKLETNSINQIGLSNSRLLATINPPSVHEMISPLEFQQYSVKNGIVPESMSMTHFIPGKCVKQILTNYQNTLNSVSNHIQNYNNYEIMSSSNTLICDKPKIYRAPKAMNIFSKFINVIVSGSQVREIMKTGHGFQLKQVQLDGLYELKTEIKEIVKLDFMQNCLK